MREYETVFILDPKLDESEVKGEIDKVESLISGLSGEVVSIEPAGKKRLAYQIRGNTEGYYTLITFKSEPSSIAEIERLYKLNEKVLRHIIVICPEKRIESASGEEQAQV
jgi:small subunit ribosomal protein S6